MPYTDLRGIPTYYEQRGAGDPVLLLHGGFCSNETWRAQVEALEPHFRVHAPERPGHGRTADRMGPVTYDDMVTDTLAYLDHAGVDRAHVVGFSDGAITALLLGMRHPERVRSIVAISANLDPDCLGGEESGEAAEEADEDSTDDPEWAGIRAAYDRLSPDGPEYGDVVLQKLSSLWQTEPRIASSELAAITAPTLVLAGDRDSIPTAHTLLIARSITDARLCVVPDAGHLVISQRPDLVNRVLLDFLAGAGQ